MKARDQWIGWDDSRREAALQQVVNNSRFLVLAAIRNLASAMLSCALRRLRSDWGRQYGLEPLLVETLVDRKRFPRGVLSGGQLDRAGGDQRSRAHGQAQRAPRCPGENHTGLPSGKKCRAPAQGREVKGDDCSTCNIVL